MNRALKSFTAAAVIGGLCVAGQARAQDPGTGGGGDAVALTTSTSPTTGATTTTAGIIVLVVLLTRKPDQPAASQEAVKATELYLRQNSIQLAQDLATGHGPVVQELARALHLRPENQAAFAELLRRNRGSLVSLADADALTPARAELFVRQVVTAMSTNASLRADLDALAARTALN